MTDTNRSVKASSPRERTLEEVDQVHDGKTPLHSRLVNSVNTSSVARAPPGNRLHQSISHIRRFTAAANLVPQLATSAAPTYSLPLADMDADGEERLLVDVGIFANNPALLGYQAAVEGGGDPKNVLLVSLGIGVPGPNSSLNQSEHMGLSWFRIAQSLLESAQAGGGSVIDGFLRTIIGDTYWRFDVALPDDDGHEMDNTSDEHVAWLDREGRAMVGDRIGDLKRLAELLPRG